MSRKLYPTDVLDQAQAVLDAWNQFSDDPTFGALTPAVMQAALAQAAVLRSQINGLEAQLTDARNQRDAHFKQVWSYTKQVRSAVKGIYGDDSSQYEMVGGTRLSERDPRTPPPPEPPTPDA